MKLNLITVCGDCIFYREIQLFLRPGARIARMVSNKLIWKYQNEINYRRTTNSFYLYMCEQTAKLLWIPTIFYKVYLCELKIYCSFKIQPSTKITNWTILFHSYLARYYISSFINCFWSPTPNIILLPKLRPHCRLLSLSPRTV